MGGRPCLLPVIGGGGGGGRWSRYAYAPLAGLAGGALANEEEITVGGVDLRFDRTGVGAVFTRISGGIEITRAGATSHAGFLTAALPADFASAGCFAVVAEVQSATFGGTANLAGWIGRIQAGPVLGPSWQAGIRASDYFSRTGNNTDAQLQSLTAGLRPAAPLRAGCLWYPPVGVVPIAAAGATLPTSDPTTGVSYGSACSTQIAQTISLSDRIGIVSFLPADSTILVSGIGFYRLDA